MTASPHTRGWTRPDRRLGGALDGFPAHAGMDLHREEERRKRPGLPRTRGDGPATGTPPDAASAASPHTRGWTNPFAYMAQADLGFPAHAGMDHPGDDQHEPDRGLPRTRGDGPVGRDLGRGPGEASPHTRGWTRRIAQHHLLALGFPAHAGMDPADPSGNVKLARLPRTRGDGPDAYASDSAWDEASPHTRGWTRPRGVARVRPDGFPAHAGMDPLPAGRALSASGLPRTRGDGPRMTSVRSSPSAASPHTRGWTRPRADGRPASCGFPAHAGMDPAHNTPDAWSPGLPRTRGDGPSVHCLAFARREASPHTRGWTRVVDDVHRGGRGFPAHAGMDLQPRLPRRLHLWLPRTRGDGPHIEMLEAGRQPASPHTRGWTLGGAAAAQEVAGFPAHAGMDPASSTPALLSPRLPRTRGDGPW